MNLSLMTFSITGMFHTSLKRQSICTTFSRGGGDGDDPVTLPDYIFSTYNALMEAGWRFDDIDRMDMLGFLKIRAWKLNREKSEKAPKKAFIDQVWPDLR